MVNQQLLDYLKEQLKVGVNQKDLKSTLLNVGWQESDIDEAFKTINSESVNLISDAVKNQDSNLVNLKNAPQVLNTDLSDDVKKQNQNISNNIPQYISKTDFVSQKQDTSLKIDLEQKPEENSFLKNINQTNSIQPQQVKIESLPQHYKKFKVIIYILFGLLVIGLLAVIFFMYKQNNNLENKLNNLISQGGDFENKSQGLNQIVNDLQKQNLSLKEENTLLTQEKFDAINQLLLFSQSTSSLDIELKGKILLENGKYFLKTSQDILVSIKNLKDEKVKKVLESFVNQELSVKGIRTPGLREITITDINNQSIDNLFQLQLEKTIQNQTSTTSTTEILNQTTTGQ